VWRLPVFSDAATAHLRGRFSQLPDAMKVTCKLIDFNMSKPDVKAGALNPLRAIAIVKVIDREGYAHLDGPLLRLVCSATVRPRFSF
jgi:hypothetical protein